MKAFRHRYLIPAILVVALGIFYNISINSQTYVPAVPIPVPITGIGTQVQVGDARQINQTANIGTTTLFTTGSQTAQYLIAATAYCDVAAAGATVNLTVTSTDPSGTSQPVQSNAACTSLGTTSFATLRATIAVKNSTNITYATTIVGSPTYDVRVEIFQLSVN